MLINRSNLLPYLMLFKVVFLAHLTISKAKRYPLFCIDTHTQFVISNHLFTFRSAGQSSGTSRGGGCKIVIGPGCCSFGTSARFCLSFLLGGMEIRCLSPLSYPLSRHLPPYIAGCATALWLGSGCWWRFHQGGERQTGVSWDHPPCLYLPPPSPCCLCEDTDSWGEGRRRQQTYTTT